MKMDELQFYEELGNWDFSQIKVKTEKLSDWDYYKKIEKYTNSKSLCLDLGTGGGEKVLENYPNVGMIIGTDFSTKMVETARRNALKYPNRNAKFVVMDNLNMQFPSDLFDLVSARHTKICAKKIYEILNKEGTLIVEGVNKKDCWSLKKVFGRGQAYNDKTTVAEMDFADIKKAGFKSIEMYDVYEDEFYETKEDLIALLLKTPILDDFSELNSNNNIINEDKKIDLNLLNQYISENKTEKGIVLHRVLYGIIAKK